MLPVSTGIQSGSTIRRRFCGSRRAWVEHRSKEALGHPLEFPTTIQAAVRKATQGDYKADSRSLLHGRLYSQYALLRPSTIPDLFGRVVTTRSWWRSVRHHKGRDPCCTRAAGIRAAADSFLIGQIFWRRFAPDARQPQMPCTRGHLHFSSEHHSQSRTAARSPHGAQAPPHFRAVALELSPAQLDPASPLATPAHPIARPPDRTLLVNRLPTSVISNDPTVAHWFQPAHFLSSSLPPPTLLPPSWRLSLLPRCL